MIIQNILSSAIGKCVEQIYGLVQGELSVAAGVYLHCYQRPHLASNDIIVTVSPVKQFSLVWSEQAFPLLGTRI